jgi:cyclase
MKQITKNIYVESETSVCNSSFVVTKDGVVVIDTPMVPQHAKTWAKKAAEFGPIRYVINTEPHGDHVSGNCYFGGMLVAHEGTRQVILDSNVEEFRKTMREMRGVAVDEDFRFRPPDITFKDRLTFYLGGVTFNLVNLPGHTPYQVVVHVPEERALFTSDNISLHIPFFHQSLPDVWPGTLKKMMEFDVDYVIPGHGDVGGKDNIELMRKNVITWVETVKKAIAAGMTLEEAQKKLDMHKEFPHFPHDERTAGIVKMNVTRLYELYKK